MIELTKQLDNGITVLYAPKDMDVVHCRFVFTVGSFNEDDKTRGISHLIEHLMFNSCPGMTSIEFNDKMTALGAVINASTSNEFTRYYFTALSEKFRECFDLYVRLLFSFKVTQPILDKELGVVCNEIGVSKDDNNSNLYEEFTGNILRMHPCSKPILGYEEVLRALSTEDVQKYFETHYNTESMYVIISGKLSDEDLDYACKALESIQRTENFGRQEITDAQRKPMLTQSSRFKDTVQTLVMSGIFVDGGYQNEILSSLVSIPLGGTMSSFLWNEFREKRSICYLISSYNSTFDPGLNMLTFYTGLNDYKDAELAVSLFKEAVDYAHGLTEEDFEKARIFKKSQTILGRQKAVDEAWDIESAIYYNLNPISYAPMDEYLDSVTFEDFKKFIDSLDSKNLVTSFLYPKEAQ